MANHFTRTSKLSSSRAWGGPCGLALFLLCGCSDGGKQPADAGTPDLAADLQLMEDSRAEFFPNSGGLAAINQIYEQNPWAYPHTLPMAEACGAWEVAPIKAAQRQPVVSAARALLLSGDLDLNTSAAWGAAAAQTLENGTHLIIPRTAHETAKVPCVSSIIESFLLADGEVAGLDTSCLQQIKAPAW